MPPPEKPAKSAHRTPSPMHDTLPLFPDESSSHRALVCKVFTACVRLSRVAKQSGFAILPVDGTRNEHTVECPVSTPDWVRTEKEQCLFPVATDEARSHPCSFALWHKEQSQKAFYTSSPSSKGHHNLGHCEMRAILWVCLG